MNRTMMIAALALLATPAAAQDGIRAQLGSCLAIPGVLQRLACYDSVAKGNGITTPARAPVAAAPMAAPMPPRTALNARPVLLARIEKIASKPRTRTTSVK